MLEHEADLPLARAYVGDIAACQQHLPRIGLLQPRDHAQQGGLAAAGRTQQGDQFAWGEFQRDLVERDEIAKLLFYISYDDAHRLPLSIDLRLQGDSFRVAASGLQR